MARCGGVTIAVRMCRDQAFRLAACQNARHTRMAPCEEKRSRAHPILRFNLQGLAVPPAQTKNVHTSFKQVAASRIACGSKHLTGHRTALAAHDTRAVETRL